MSQKIIIFGSFGPLFGVCTLRIKTKWKPHKVIPWCWHAFVKPLKMPPISSSNRKMIRVDEIQRNSFLPCWDKARKLDRRDFWKSEKYKFLNVPRASETKSYLLLGSIHFFFIAHFEKTHFVVPDPPICKRVSDRIWEIRGDISKDDK